MLVTVDRGLAIVPKDEWARLVALETLYDSISNCKTWGEYRSLDCKEINEFVLDATGFDDVQPDDEPFELDIREYFGVEGPTFESALESATFDFIDSAEDFEIDDGDYELWGTWAWIFFEAEERVKAALQEAGYKVERDF